MATSANFIHANGNIAFDKTRKLQQLAIFDKIATFSVFYLTWPKPYLTSPNLTWPQRNSPKPTQIHQALPFFT